MGNQIGKVLWSEQRPLVGFAVANTLGLYEHCDEVVGDGRSDAAILGVVHKDGFCRGVLPWLYVVEKLGRLAFG